MESSQTKLPLFVRGVQKHGVVVVDPESGNDQAVCDCPWCEAESKFYINTKTGLWDCKVCSQKGNFEQFLGLVAARNAKRLSGTVALTLSKDRGISTRTSRAWNIGWDGKFYTTPIYGNITNSGEFMVTDVKTFRPGTKSMSTPGSKNGLMLRPEDPFTDEIWLCEGEWDTQAWWEMVRATGSNDTVTGISGNGTFPSPQKSRLPNLFQGKTVYILFDNDTAGHEGTIRTYKILKQIAKRVGWLRWPDSYPKKYDIRDLILENGKKPTEITALVRSFLTFEAPDIGQAVGDGLKATPDGQNALYGAVQAEESMTGTGISAEEAEEEYKKWLHIEDRYVLDVLFGSVFANRLNSDPFWLFLVAPPSGSKSELLMTLTNAPKIYTITSVTPHALVSGSFGAGGDPSLIPDLLGKTLVIKDFTTILTLNQTARDEIFGILRDAYDGKIEKKFGNSVHRRYEGKFGIIAGVTPAIEQYSTTNLGERFLKYRIKRLGGVDTGREIIMRAMQNIGREDAMRHGLQEVSKRVLDRPVLPQNMPNVEAYYDRTVKLAQWTAVMRGQVMKERYTQVVMYKPEHETGARLAKQLLTFGMGVSIFRGEQVMSERTFKAVQEVAKSTVPDRAEEVVRQIYGHYGDDYVKLEDISVWTRLPRETCRPLCQDLELLHVFERDPRRQGYWRLSDKMFELTASLNLYRKGSKTKKKLVPKGKTS